MGVRDARPDDAASLAALSIEVWISTYLRHGVTPDFAGFVLTTFTPDRFLDALDDPDERLLVSDNRDGIDGYIRITANRPHPFRTVRRSRSARSTFNRAITAGASAVRFWMRVLTMRAGASGPLRSG